MASNNAFTLKGAVDKVKKVGNIVNAVSNPAQALASSVAKNYLSKLSNKNTPKYEVVPVDPSTVVPRPTSPNPSQPRTGTSTGLMSSQPRMSSQTTPTVVQKDTTTIKEPIPLDSQSNAQRVITSGQQTPLEQTATQKLYEAGQATPLEREYIERVQKAQGMKNAGMLGGYSEAGQYAGQNPEQLYDSLINAPDLVGRAGASKGLYDAFSNIYGSQATQGLLAANTIAGRGLTSAQSGLVGAQNQASRAQEGAGTVLSSGLPQYPSYGSQIINPLTGQSVDGGSSGSLQDAVSNAVSRLLGGQMTYDDAVNSLAGYGQGGINALQQALPPNFNIAQSNTLAGQQGSVGINYQLADEALKNTEQIMESLGLFSNMPVLNKARTWASLQSGLGGEQTRAYIGAVQSLRNAYASLLASSKGGTPTEYSNQAMAEIPEIPTKKDLEAIRHNFETLGQARKDILGNPGQATSGSQTGGGFAEAW